MGWLGDLRKCISSGLRSRRGRARPFSRLAAEALAELALHETVAPEELLGTLYTRGGISSGHRAAEIAPLYDGPHFTINVHLWVDSFAVPHSHNWDGAFQVVSGTSLYSTYRFVPDQLDTPSFKIGRVSTVETSLASPGSVHEVTAGMGYIHSIFHIDRPSLSISVRGEIQDRPMTVWRSGVAEQTDLSVPPIETRLKCLRVLAEMGPRACDPWIAAMLKTVSLQELNLLLEEALLKHSDGAEVRRLVRAQRPRLGPGLDVVLAAAEERLRVRWFIGMRGRIHAPDHRFFLGLMCFGPDRDTIFRMIRERHPGASPPELLACWVRELTRPSRGGAPPLDFALGEDAIEIFSLLLQHGAPRAAAEATASPRTRKARARELEACEEGFRRLRLLAPLFPAAHR